MVRGTLVVVALLLATLAAPARAQEDAASGQQLNHAAVVVDTGDGTVRKMCLAFPEAEISGIEALRRVDTRPHRFETFAGKGSGVCMLCGVGCASGDCFCNPDKYWAYHRAGPGETTYRSSPLGASSTVVRNGDVEAWKWGPGTAPEKVSVSQVCGIEEPPARTTSATTTTTSALAPTTTEATQPPTSTTPTPTPTAAPTSTPGARPQPADGTGATTSPPSPAATDPSQSEVAEAPQDEQGPEEAAAPSGAEVKRSLGAEEGAAADATQEEEGTSGGQLATGGAFTALLGGLLVWRSRLRRAKVRRVRPVR